MMLRHLTRTLGAGGRATINLARCAGRSACGPDTATAGRQAGGRPPTRTAVASLPARASPMPQRRCLHTERHAGGAHGQLPWRVAGGDLGWRRHSVVPRAAGARGRNAPALLPTRSSRGRAQGARPLGQARGVAFMLPRCMQPLVCCARAALLFHNHPHPASRPGRRLTRPAGGRASRGSWAAGGRGSPPTCRCRQTSSSATCRPGVRCLLRGWHGAVLTWGSHTDGTGWEMRSGPCISPLQRSSAPLHYPLALQGTAWNGTILWCWCPAAASTPRPSCTCA